MADEDDITNQEEDVPEDEGAAEISIESLERDLQYARAEIANVRSRALRERADLIRYSSRRLGLKMLDVLRSLDLAIKSSKDSSDSTLEGLRLTAESMNHVPCLDNLQYFARIDILWRGDRCNCFHTAGVEYSILNINLDNPLRREGRSHAFCSQS